MNREPVNLNSNGDDYKMTYDFNADEIFQMAEKIERNGAKFYRQTAESCHDLETKNMLLDMAKMEDGHLTAFQEMRMLRKSLETIDDRILVFRIVRRPRRPDRVNGRLRMTCRARRNSDPADQRTPG